MIKTAFITTYLACLTFLGSISHTQAQFGESPSYQSFNIDDQNSNDSSKTKSSLLSSVKSIAPGETFQVALKLEQPKDWHSYYHNDGVGISKSPTITWEVPEGFTTSPLIFPAPHQFDSFGLNAYGYEGTHYFFTNITAPSDMAHGGTATLSANANWQICKVSCINETGKHSIQVICSPATVQNPEFSSEVSDYQKKYVPDTLETPENWTVTATEIDNEIKIKIITDKELPYDLKFYEFQPIRAIIQGKP